MYLEHFGLHRLPFTISPDPDFLYPSPGHQEALAHLSYALTDQGGLVCLTGEVGTGKTTLCRALMACVSECDHLAYIFNPQLSPTELLESLCDELGIKYPPGVSLKSLYLVLNRALLKFYSLGERVICVVDEAQSMPASLLEQIRLLTNLETNSEKLLTLVLVGQPELNDMLARHDLRQLNQRITARYHLDHLSEQETANYLQHRLVCAGGQNILFDRSAVKTIWKMSAGVPRLINSIADRSLLGAYVLETELVTGKIAQRACVEVMGSHSVSKNQNTKLGKSNNYQNSSQQVNRLLIIALWAIVILGSITALFVFREDLFKRLGWNVASVTDAISRVSLDQLSTPKDPAALLAQQLNVTLDNDVDTAGTYCEQLIQQDIQCLWVDWPVLELRSIKPPVAVRKADGEWQVLDFQTQRYQGEALVLWPMPDGYREPIRPGETSPVIREVRKILNVNWNAEWASIGPSGVSVIADPEFYDPLLEKAVTEFQLLNGLQADRVIGPRTLIYLNRNN
ncbi:MAG: AAA family ATPase [Oleibacter sp.]|nr:AAA family ATPase [Thalassolituus sp.]